MFIENFPDEIELLAFFESEPVYFERENVSFIYHVKDDHGFSIDFSFSIVEGWVHYVIKHGEVNVVDNSIDGVGSLLLGKDTKGEYLYVELNSNSFVSRTEVRVAPYISISGNVFSK
ncbi:hypothetical protein SB6411_00003 [Klebsiella spallanzanii]|uniref:Uncharacterized protein n=1 Tax=Klebsiella spallanzanii TaxID=2587528 RepID=A0ABY6V6J6_9ENTR|nr:hypothetical protein [Klebsiella spallanzanii]VUS21850.1 hypothetical protein SB6411_00003 [Klebsiella spallanzanii]VUT03174.1 hypothetical protein SB6419_05271 [Klebsiella spallanzanii]